MKIVGCDLHTRYQQIAMLDAETGELVERRLEHESGEVSAAIADCPGRPRPNQGHMFEASGSMHFTQPEQHKGAAVS